jgi:hypothetical protein
VGVVRDTRVRSHVRFHQVVMLLPEAAHYISCPNSIIIAKVKRLFFKTKTITYLYRYHVILNLSNHRELLLISYFELLSI